MKILRSVMLSVLSLALVFVANTATVGASGCKVITNPGMSFFSWWAAPGGVTTLPMGFSTTQTTGGSTSTCSDINIANIHDSNPQMCADFGGYAQVAVQYLSGGVWYNDTQGATFVPCDSSSLFVVGVGYANNTPFRVLINIGAGPSYPWPTFKLYV